MSLFVLLWCACTALCVLLIASVGHGLIVIAQARTHADAVALAVVLGDESAAQALAQLVNVRIISINTDGSRVSVVVESAGVRILAQASR